MHVTKKGARRQSCNRHLHPSRVRVKETGGKQRGTCKENQRGRTQESVKHDKYLHPVVGREREKVGSRRKAKKGDKQDGQRSKWNREGEISQAENKKHIDRTCQSAEVNERWRKRRGETLLLSGRQRGKQQEEAGFNQILSRSVCCEWASPPGCSFTEMMHAAEGLMALHAGRSLSALKTVTETKIYSQMFTVNSGERITSCKLRCRSYKGQKIQMMKVT